MSFWKKYLSLVMISMSSLLLVGCVSMGSKLPPLQTVERVDVERYAGDWYVIANIPYFAEKGNVAARVNYRARPDGRFDDEYYYKKKKFTASEKLAKGIAWTLNDEATHWRSRFYWPFTFDFYVIGLDDDYQVLALGHPSRKYGWLMARQPQLSDEVYAEWMLKLVANGYQTEQFLKVPQRAEDLGQAGFQ